MQRSSLDTDELPSSRLSEPPLHDHDVESNQNSEPSSGGDAQKWWHHFAAGEVGGMIGSFMCHPFDTAKTRIQMQSHHSKSTIGFITEIARNEGVPALYRGVLYPFVGFGMIFSVAFGVNGVCQDLCLYRHRHQINAPTDSSQLSLIELTLCGSVAGWCSSFVRSPIERVKTWSQIHHTNTWQSTRTLYRRYGIFGLCYGVRPTMSREVPQFACYYPIYELTCSLLSPDARNKSEMSGTVIYLAGASAGVGCWVLTYPIDVIKTRIQASAPGTYISMNHCASDIYRTKGIRPFFNGLAPTIVRAAILHSAIFLCYERVLDFCRSGYY